MTCRTGGGHDGSAPQDPAHVGEFFTERAAGWDVRFAGDGPVYRAAVAELTLEPGDTVLDAGCGTGRALPVLREAVGDRGTILGFDLTPAMLHEVVRAGRTAAGWVAVADTGRLPLRDGCLDAVFAAGLICHLPDPAAGFREMARVVREGGLLALFHPVGRAAHAARHEGRPPEHDLRAEPVLRPLLAECGWRLTSCSDRDDRYLALAERL